MGEGLCFYEYAIPDGIPERRVTEEAPGHQAQKGAALGTELDAVEAGGGGWGISVGEGDGRGGRGGGEDRLPIEQIRRAQQRVVRPGGAIHDQVNLPGVHTDGADHGRGDGIDKDLPTVGCA